VFFTPPQQLAQTLGANMNFAFNLVNGFLQPYPMIPVRREDLGGGLEGVMLDDGWGRVGWVGWRKFLQSLFG